VSINFSFKGDNQDITAVAFILQGTDSTIVESNNGHFLYSHGFLQKGLYNLKMNLIFYPGHYSGGYLLDCKDCIVTKTLFLKIIDNYYTYANEEIVNGYLKISFMKYMNPDLAEYEISRSCNDGQTVVGRVKIPEYTDSTYVGEGGFYKIKVNTTSGNVYYWGQADFNQKIPMPAFYSTPENNYYLAWNKSKFYNAVDKYYAVLSNSAEGVYFDNPGDTIMILPDGQYGQVMSILLSVVPKNGNIIYESGQRSAFQSFTYFTIGK
jgi:hypothetical protein